MRSILHSSFFISSCTPEVENVFGETASHRVAQQLSDYYAILESQPQGWVLDFYPSDRIEGGVVYTACFKDGMVTMACEQDINNTDISKKFTKGTEMTSAYQIVSETGVLLTFDTYNPLFHYWSQPFKGHAKGYESDYEFTFISASSDSVVLRGKRYGNMLRMYPLPQAATDYVKKVADMRSVLTPITRKRATVDGTTYPVTMAYSLFSYDPSTGSGQGTSTGSGQRCSMPFVHTPDGIRFYEPVTLGGVSVSQLTFDSDSQELRSADGRFVLPKPTTIEQSFVAPQTQWLFSYKASSGTPSDMCDELLSIVTHCANVINNGSWGEKVRELYLGANMESFANDRHRWVLGWHTRLSGAIDFYVGYAVDMNVVDAGRQLVSIQMVEPANLFSNYGYWQPFVDFVGKNSPYLLSFDNDDAPKTVTLTSERDATKWFKLKKK
ncbi:MAG: DUF4302 domain-containing protein [Prevotella sp.]|nr:DUF4302 domain-containing protein [Prevotella sp.]